MHSWIGPASPSLRAMSALHLRQGKKTCVFPAFTQLSVPQHKARILFGMNMSSGICRKKSSIIIDHSSNE